MKVVPIAALWRKMPPAVFPCILGLAGLALAWRTGGPLLGVGLGVHYMLLLLAIVIYGFLLGLYVRKFIQRPGVFWDEIKTIPGRLGLSAMILSMTGSRAPVSDT